MGNYVYVATSIDGYIAKKDGSVDWLADYPNPDASDFGFAEFMAGMDVVVMGRNTFEKVLTFGQWPYEKPVCVLSRTLRGVPDQLVGKAEIVEGAPVSIVERLNARGHQNIYVDGGRVIQSFLSHDLIDEMVITRVPMVLGNGVPLFGTTDSSLKFTLTGSEVLIGQLVMSKYSRVRR